MNRVCAPCSWTNLSPSVSWPDIGKDWPTLRESLTHHADASTTTAARPGTSNCVPAIEATASAILQVAEPDAICEGAGSDMDSIGSVCAESYECIADAHLRDDDRRLGSRKFYARGTLAKSRVEAAPRASFVSGQNKRSAKRHVVGAAQQLPPTAQTRVTPRSAAESHSCVSSRTRVMRSLSKRTAWRRPTPHATPLDVAEEALISHGDSKSGGLSRLDDDVVLYVFSLPDLRLVRRHILLNVALRGLASDLAGSTLLVSDSHSGGVHVIAWPLSHTSDLRQDAGELTDNSRSTGPCGS